MSCMIHKKMKASITVEAAIVIPVMVLVLIPFLYLLRIVLVQTMLEADLQNILTKAATESYVLERAGVKPAEEEEGAQGPIIEQAEEKAEELGGLLGEWTALFTGMDLGEMLEETLMDLAGQWYLQCELSRIWSDEALSAWGVESGWGGISLLESRFFYAEEDRGGLIRGVMEITWSFPGGFSKPTTKIVRVVHAFLGEKDAAMGPGKTGKAETEEIVYRIGQGAHFHKLSCFLIDKNIEVLTRTQAEARGLGACPVCGGSGDTVYVTDGGEKFHTHTCSILFPDLNPMSRIEAEAAGLTPCGLCFGSEGYFR